MRSVCLLLLAVAVVTPPASAEKNSASQRRDKAQYVPKFRDPVIEELKERDKTLQKKRDDKTSKIRKKQKAQKEADRKKEKSLKATLPAALRPTSPKSFATIWHNPPRPQYMTGTCWSFGTIAMLESEVKRQSGQEVKISEMHTVYYEYLEKAARFIRERGDSYLAQGSESNAVTRIWKKYGAVPLEVYPGVVNKDGRHDHQQLFREYQALLQHAKAESLWDETLVLDMVRVVLDKYLGRPPQQFDYKGVQYTPKSFLKNGLKIDPDAYLEIMSTMSQPYYTKGEFKVPDNWWHDANYHNVPLDVFYKNFVAAIKGGYSMTIAIDVSEPGKDGLNDAIFVPSYDIPQAFIDEHSREYRLAHKVTTDDHGVQVVGYTSLAGQDWFLLKDSGRSSRRGRHKGYYFLREDYVRLKMLGYTVHKDAVPDLARKFGNKSTAKSKRK